MSKTLSVAVSLLIALVSMAQTMEPTLDIVQLVESDGTYTVTKTNVDTSIIITLDSPKVIQAVLSRYKAELSNPSSKIDTYTPYQKVLAPIRPLRDQVLIYRSGAFSDFAIEALTTKKPLGHESHKQHKYFGRNHSIYYGASLPAQTAAVQRAVAGEGTVIMVTDATNVEDAELILARSIRDDFGGAIHDLQDLSSLEQAAEKARIVHIGGIGQVTDNGIRIDNRRLQLRAENVTATYDTSVADEDVAPLLEDQVKAVLVSNNAGRQDAHQKIIQRYYRQLFDGDRKHDALKASVTRYIRNVSSAEEAHPFYWTGIRQYGDIKSIDGNVPSKLYWLLIVVMVILFVILKRSGGRLY